MIRKESRATHSQITGLLLAIRNRDRRGDQASSDKRKPLSLEQGEVYLKISHAKINSPTGGEKVQALLQTGTKEWAPLLTGFVNGGRGRSKHRRDKRPGRDKVASPLCRKRAKRGSPLNKDLNKQGGSQQHGGGKEGAGEEAHQYGVSSIHRSKKKKWPKRSVSNALQAPEAEGAQGGPGMTAQLLAVSQKRRGAKNMSTIPE